ncbi:hypothetical protein E2C01_020176 [Portunus trituberculatus]|uniref:Uncharacterized protein n=1 Tax=Portunus trituberculatus TaxID=210409 RepID=A0A5B7E1C9_PORTR|nr:hypothetical protein [Portunus trituberculatus]
MSEEGGKSTHPRRLPSESRLILGSCFPSPHRELIKLDAGKASRWPGQADVTQEVKNGQILSGVWRGHLSHAVPSLPQEVTQICTVATVTAGFSPSTRCSTFA